MSDLKFHKSCYTARSSGYKYRTLSTNTGSKKKRDSVEDTSFERKIRELNVAIVSRVTKEVNSTNEARESILEKFSRLDAKINAMLEIQQTVAELNNNLENVSLALVSMTEKVNKIEMQISRDTFAQQSQMTTFKLQDVITEEKEDHDSIVTHV